MTKTRDYSAFQVADFFVLRTPLLSFDEFLKWSDGLKAPQAMSDPVSLPEAISADRQKLGLALREIMSRPEVREALFVASPELEGTFSLWNGQPETERSRGIDLSMARYFSRMTGRATPFGLCAGCSVGKIGAVAALRIAERSSWKKHTQLSVEYLSALADSLGSDATVRDAFLYWPNSSLYHMAGHFRYLERFKKAGKAHSYHLVAVEDSEALTEILQRAGNGALFSDLVSSVTTAEISSAEAAEYVQDLIDNQILIPDIIPPVTGEEPAEVFVQRLREHLPTSPVAAKIAAVNESLAAMDRTGVGTSPQAYRDVATLLQYLPVAAELSHLFHIDMIKPAGELTLSQAVLNELLHGVRILHSLARPDATAALLTPFRQAFVDRYDREAVPILEALDEEAGIGFPVSPTFDAASPLLKGLTFSNPVSPTQPWSTREKFLLHKLGEALSQGAQEIVLDEHELDEIAHPTRFDLPDAFAVMARVAAASEAAMNEGDFRVFVTGVNGPSGAFFFGRFCHAAPDLSAHVREHLRAEEQLRPHAIFAEIAYLPDGPFGNLAVRPVLREHEIPCFTPSGVSHDKQIELADLFLRVRGDRVILFSKSRDREVIPRLTSAHDFDRQGPPLYRFLCALQDQGTAPLGWDWGDLWGAPFLPRVVCGKIVLARARWLVTAKEIVPRQPDPAASFAALQKWRADHRVCRFVALVEGEGDQALALDLDNVICVEILLRKLKPGVELALLEMFPSPDLLPVSAPDGRYTHELIVPFVRTRLTGVPIVPSSARINQGLTVGARVFPPGSEWLYAKLYCGPVTVDRLLRGMVAPLVKEFAGAGAIDRWFFIRYRDPDWHLRLRFHGKIRDLQETVRPALEKAAESLLDGREIRRVQFDTYEREIERYGGLEAMLLSEQLFQADSEAILSLLDGLAQSGADADQRWRVALLGLDRLLSDFEFNLPTKRAIVENWRLDLAREFQVNAGMKKELSDRFRQERKALEGWLSKPSEASEASAMSEKVFRQRSGEIIPIVASLKTIEKTNGLTSPLSMLAASYLHMHVNRLLISTHRAHELVLYDFLVRLYDSKIALAR